MPNSPVMKSPCGFDSFRVWGGTVASAQVFLSAVLVRSVNAVNNDRTSRCRTACPLAVQYRFRAVPYNDFERHPRLVSCCDFFYLRAHNPKVGGSNPPPATKRFNHLQDPPKMAREQ